MGGSTTGDTMAMIPVFEDAKLPFISLGGAVIIIDPVKKFVFKTPHTDKMACEKIFEDMKARGLTKIGMISGQDAFGKSMQEECKKVVGKYGIEMLADETYGPRDTDMTPAAHQRQGQGGSAGGAQCRASVRAQPSSRATSSSSASPCRSTRATASPRRASLTPPATRPKA